MKTTAVKASPRNDLSKATTKQLRRDDKVPAVLLDNGKATSITIDYDDAKTLLFTSDTYIVGLEIDGESMHAIVREAQYHPITDQILHLDLLRIDPTKPVELVLPIVTTGTAVGIIEGGKLTLKLRKIKVRGIPNDLPNEIPVDVTSLALGTSMKISDVDFGDLEIVTNHSAALASVEIPRALRSAGAGTEEEGEEGEEGTEEAAAAE